MRISDWSSDVCSSDLATAASRLADLAAGGELETLPFEEPRKLQRAAKDGDRAPDELIQANLRLVVSIAKRYDGRGMQLLDLIQDGHLGLMPAVQKVDDTQGLQFHPYATGWIRQRPEEHKYELQST